MMRGKIQAAEMSLSTGGEYLTFSDIVSKIKIKTGKKLLSSGRVRKLCVTIFI